eukprot:scaffold4879_cov354-Prasinococcus_capsulatus_cf.AAC.7
MSAHPGPWPRRDAMLVTCAAAFSTKGPGTLPGFSAAKSSSKFRTIRIETLSIALTVGANNQARADANPKSSVTSARSDSASTIRFDRKSTFTVFLLTLLSHDPDWMKNSGLWDRRLSTLSRMARFDVSNDAAIKSSIDFALIVISRVINVRMGISVSNICPKATLTSSIMPKALSGAGSPSVACCSLKFCTSLS